jgi:NAD+ kinase
MIEQDFSFSKIALISHPQIPQAVTEVNAILSKFNEYDIGISHSHLGDKAFQESIQEGEFDLLIALGGDGTMLRAGHLCAPYSIPILGINFGHFGFLIEIRENQWAEFIPRLIKGDFWLENRMMLCAEQWRENHLLGSWDVLNEVVVSRGKIMRPVKLDTSVDGRFLTTYVADGLIASTPTGSTAYALAAGGPILPPELRNILLVAVAPHLSIDRAIVLAEGSSVSIIVHTDHHAVLSVDGQNPVDLMSGDRLEARAGQHTTRFVRFQDPGYFYRNLTPHMYNNPSTGNSK